MLLLQLMLITLISLLAITLISSLIFSLTGSNAEQCSTSLLKIIQLLSQIFTFIIPPFIFFKINHFNTKEFLGINYRPQLTIWLCALLILLISIPLIDWLIEVNSKMALPDSMRLIETWMQEMENKSTELTYRFLNTDKIGGLIANLFIIAIIPAIGEELMFRGCIQKLLTTKMRSPHLAIIITAIIFSAAHFQFYGFLARMVLGLILGYCFFYGRNILIPIIIHLTNNSIAIISQFVLYNSGSLSSVQDNTPSYSNIYLAIISLLLVVALILWMRRQFLAQKKPV